MKMIGPGVKTTAVNLQTRRAVKRGDPEKYIILRVLSTIAQIQKFKDQLKLATPWKKGNIDWCQNL